MKAAILLRRKHRLHAFPALLLLFLVHTGARAAAPADPRPRVDAGSLLDRMNGQEIVSIQLIADLDSLVDNRYADRYYEGQFFFSDRDGIRYHLPVSVRARGKFRRRHCDFPPLKLKFDSESLVSAGFNRMNELKLVTHCLDDRITSTEQVFREYLAYKLYNILTPHSFRVQLVKVTYQDAGEKKRKLKRWGLLIEDLEELEARTGTTTCECLGQTGEALHPNHEKITALFQYMIGNTDWDIPMLRNVKLLQLSDGQFVPVPYDFDFSTLVNAPYARPNTNVGQHSMQQRVYLGEMRTARELQPILRYFQRKQEPLYQTVRSFRQLPEASRQEILRFLDSFYLEIENPEDLADKLFATRPVGGGPTGNSP
ncbi:MAG: hypothetical protein RLY31_821 [Bacteroidota bacterium]|jgi:hypothetical protein